MNVHWTEAAIADLRAVEAYIGRHSGQYAAGMVDRITARTAILADQPLLGPTVPEYGSDDVRELLEDPYRIIYRVLDNQVDVLAVIHSARRLPRSL
jgi:toxin ParE1/3/4